MYKSEVLPPSRYMQASWMRKLAVSKADIMAAIKERMEEGQQRMYEPMTQVCHHLSTSMDCVWGNPSKTWQVGNPQGRSTNSTCETSGRACCTCTSHGSPDGYDNT
jgi:hypothetical protein